MKISKRQLKRIIREEKIKILQESPNTFAGQALSEALHMAILQLLGITPGGETSHEIQDKIEEIVARYENRF